MNLLNLRGESADTGGLGILLGFKRGKTGFGVCQLRFVFGQHLLEQVGLKAAFAHQGAHDFLTQPGVLLLKAIQIGLRRLDLTFQTAAQMTTGLLLPDVIHRSGKAVEVLVNYIKHGGFDFRR